jgi:aspartokinase-like uncharacterized kinase
MATIVYKVGGSLLNFPGLADRLRDVLAQAYPSPDVVDVPGTNRVLIAGGGETADAVRRWDRMHTLGDEASHTLALHAMEINARLVAAILPEARLIRRFPESPQTSADGHSVILSPRELVEALERTSGELLPRSWGVTSDSIAAYVAVHCRADALVLIKSVPCPLDEPLASQDLCLIQSRAGPAREATAGPPFQKLIGPRNGGPAAAEPASSHPTFKKAIALLASAVERGLVDSYFPSLAPRIGSISWVDLRASRPTIEPWLSALPNRVR